MNKRWQKSVIVAYLKKELLETRNSFIPTLLLCVFVSNLMQLMNQQQLINVTDKVAQSYLLGDLMIYLVAVSILFLGSTLADRFFVDERRSKVINAHLALGMDTRSIWAGKLLAVGMLLLSATFVTVVTNILIVKVIWGIGIRFTMQTIISTFIGIPLLGFSMVSLLSVAYWRFKKLSIIRMVFPLASYIGIWSIATMVINIPFLLSITFVLLSVFIFFIAYLCISKMPIQKICDDVQ